MADYTGMTWVEDRQLYGNGFPTCTIEIYDTKGTTASWRWWMADTSMMRHFKRRRDVILVTSQQAKLVVIPKDLCVTEITPTIEGGYNVRWWELKGGKPRVVDSEEALKGSEEFVFWRNILREGRSGKGTTP